MVYNDTFSTNRLQQAIGVRNISRRVRVLASEADERHGNPLPGNQQLLVVRDKVGRPPGETGVGKSVECDIFPSVL